MSAESPETPQAQDVESTVPADLTPTAEPTTGAEAGGTPPAPRELSASEQEQVAAWLEEAETAARAEEWDQSIALYRKALAFDRYLQAVEAKLQWALRMRDIDKLYREGKAKLEAGEHEAALVPLRKARVMYASHYKDVDDLILQAQTALQKEKWDARPVAESAARGKRSPIFFVGSALVVVAALLMLALLYLQSGQGSSLPTLASSIPQVSGPVTTTPSGLQIVEVQRGTGVTAGAGHQVSVHYTGYLVDGTEFDSSKGGDPITFTLGAGNVIPGWDEGIAGMQVGGKRRLIIPPQLAYGAAGAGGVIPPNAVLVFDVELTDVQ